MPLLYSRPDPSVNGNSRIVNGRGLIHRHLDRHQLALLAADWVDGTARIQPSLGQACRLLGVPIALVREHLKVRHVRRLKATAELGQKSNGHDLDDDELLAVIERAGVERTWDAITKIVG
jgi:hypothetical protein